MARDKFIDFKFITIFRMLFILLTILTFLMPWTNSQESADMGGIGFHPKVSLCSGYDYVIGCNPIYDAPLLVETPYLILTPIILIIAFALLFLQKTRYVIVSMAVTLFSAFPIITWLYDINTKIPVNYYDNIRITYGIQCFVFLLIINVIIGFITLRYSEIESVQKA